MAKQTKRRNIRTRIVSAVCAIAMAAGTAVAVTPDASAAPIYPTKLKDSWYNVPYAKYKNLPHGRLLKTRPKTLTFVNAPTINVQQLLFVSTNSHGKKILATALLLRQPQALTIPNTPVFVYNHFINSLGPQCQPSVAFTTPRDKFMTPASATVAAQISAGLQIALKLGWTMLLPDFEGMHASYGANILSGHIILDATTALVMSPKFNFRKSRILMGGYSGGAMTTVMAAAMAPKYAPAPNFVGAIAGGTPVDTAWMGLALGNKTKNPGFGIIAGSLLGMEREYPKRMNIYARMKPQWQKLLKKGLKNACVTNMIGAFQGESFDSVFKNLDVRKQKSELKVSRENSPLYYPLNPKMPIYLYHGNKDIAVPVSKVKQLARRWCKSGTKVTLATMNLSEHMAAFGMGLPGALIWGKARMAGLPANNPFCRGIEYNIMPFA